MQPLSTEARARLAAFRSAESPDPAIADRCLAALEPRLELADGPAAAPPRRLAAPLALAFALAAGVLLALGWAVTRGVSAPRSDMAAPYQSHGDPLGQLALPRAPGPAPRAHATVAAPADDADEAPVAAEPPVPPDIRDESPDAVAAREEPVLPDTSAAPRRPARADSDIAAEVDLLRRAKLAGPSDRLALLKEHARRFPAGHLAAERELLVIETRCELNEVESARFLAERFMRRFPHSPLVERAATICGGPDSGP